MRYDHIDSRRAFVAGARTAVDAVALHLLPPNVRELEQWLDELEAWTDGAPPEAPNQWPDD